MKEKMSVPGPKYEVVTATQNVMNRSPIYKFGSTKKDGYFKNYVKNVIPGPGNYNMTSFVDSMKTSFRYNIFNNHIILISYSFGKSRRDLYY